MNEKNKLDEIVTEGKKWQQFKKEKKWKVNEDGKEINENDFKYLTKLNLFNIKMVTIIPGADAINISRHLNPKKLENLKKECYKKFSVV